MIVLVLCTCTRLLLCTVGFVDVEEEEEVEVEVCTGVDADVEVGVEKAEKTGLEMIGECSLSHLSKRNKETHSNSFKFIPLGNCEIDGGGALLLLGL